MPVPRAAAVLPSSRSLKKPRPTYRISTYTFLASLTIQPFRTPFNTIPRCKDGSYPNTAGCHNSGFLPRNPVDYCGFVTRGDVIDFHRSFRAKLHENQKAAALVITHVSFNMQTLLWSIVITSPFDVNTNAYVPHRKQNKVMRLRCALPTRVFICFYAVNLKLSAIY